MAGKLFHMKDSLLALAQVHPARFFSNSYSVIYGVAGRRGKGMRWLVNSKKGKCHVSSHVVTAER